MDDQSLDSRLRQELEPFIGKSGSVAWSDRAIDHSAVWNFCEAVEDGNPVYWDTAAAERSRFGRIIAPPQALMALSMPVWWLPPFMRDQLEAERRDATPAPDVVARETVLSKFGFTTATNVTREEEYLDAFGPGDGRIGRVETFAAISAPKQTKVGLGVFITTEIDYLAERDNRLIAKAKNVLLMYDSNKPRD